MEDRNDISELLLNGLPPDEREHVINVIKQGDAEKLRRKRAEQARPPQGTDPELDELDDDRGAGTGRRLGLRRTERATPSVRTRRTARWSWQDDAIEGSAALVSTEA